LRNRAYFRGLFARDLPLSHSHERRRRQCVQQTLDQDHLADYFIAFVATSIDRTMGTPERCCPKWSLRNVTERPESKDQTTSDLHRQTTPITSDARCPCFFFGGVGLFGSIKIVGAVSRHSLPRAFSKASVFKLTMGAVGPRESLVRSGALFRNTLDQEVQFGFAPSAVCRILGVAQIWSISCRCVAH